MMPYANKEQCEKFLSQLPTECCLKCRFFTPYEPAYLVEFEREFIVKLQGDCRRRSPVLMQIENVMDTLFPEVRAEEWCGEFEMTSEERGIKYVYWE